jgi:hypothetical protein
VRIPRIEAKRHALRDYGGIAAIPRNVHKFRYRLFLRVT